MLEAAIILQLTLGERLEAAMIAALLIFNVGLGVFQEGRANAALALLKQRLSLKAQAKRDGRWQVIPAETLVPGDNIRLTLGSIVPADVRVLAGDLLVDESMLTGEAVPVEVDAGASTYASALVRRGEATALVTATGRATYFGRTAELVTTATVESSETKAILGLVRNLSVLNAVIVIVLATYAHHLGLSTPEILMLVLTLLLAAVPVALPTTFTVASTLGARTLAARGVLLTRLTALEEAAIIDVLCADKTGALTENVLTVTSVKPLVDGYTADDVLAYAACASSAGSGDPIDTAMCQAAASAQVSLLEVTRFIPFDPSTKRSEAFVRKGTLSIHVAKGAPVSIANLTATTPDELSAVEAFDTAGYRTLAIAAGPEGEMRVIGLVAFSDKARPDSASLLERLRSLGVQTVMVTGDAPATASAVAHSIGLDGPVCPAAAIPDHVAPSDFAVYAGVFPEDKFRLVKAFQQSGHSVGMCGDGANDAPALKQAQMGIAVSTATDVAKASAGVVLTAPGLEGIVTTIEEGRSVFQRVLTYALSITVNKAVTLVILGIGLILTRHAVLTPLLQALSMLTNDFVGMARTADRVTPTRRPNAWRIRNLMLAGIPLALAKLIFCAGVLAIGDFVLHFSGRELQTLTFVMFVFAGQSLIYVLRERGRMWHSRPSAVMMFFSVLDVALVSCFAARGILMQPIPASTVAALFAATALFALVLDEIKVASFAHWQVD